MELLADALEQLGGRVHVYKPRLSSILEWRMHPLEDDRFGGVICSLM